MSFHFAVDRYKSSSKRNKTHVRVGTLWGVEVSWNKGRATVGKVSFCDAVSRAVRCRSICFLLNELFCWSIWQLVHELTWSTNRANDERCMVRKDICCGKVREYIVNLFERFCCHQRQFSKCFVSASERTSKQASEEGKMCNLLPLRLGLNQSQVS